MNELEKSIFLFDDDLFDEIGFLLEIRWTRWIHGGSNIYYILPIILGCEIIFALKFTVSLALLFPFEFLLFFRYLLKLSNSKEW